VDTMLGPQSDLLWLYFPVQAILHRIGYTPHVAFDGEDRNVVTRSLQAGAGSALAGESLVMSQVCHRSGEFVTGELEETTQTR